MNNWLSRFFLHLPDDFTEICLGAQAKKQALRLQQCDRGSIPLTSTTG